DGGGALPLDELIADVRLRAISAHEWLVDAGGTVLGKGGPDSAIDAAMTILERLARTGRKARGRNLDETTLRAVADTLHPAPRPAPVRTGQPVGRFALRD